MADGKHEAGQRSWLPMAILGGVLAGPVQLGYYRNGTRATATVTLGTQP